MLELNLQIIGGVLLGLALLHGIFPKYFRWKEELARMSLINRQMMQVHSFFLALALFLVGLLCLRSAHLLVGTSLGKDICLGLGIFWGARLLVQFFGYSPENWRGKGFETAVHVVFILCWSYFSMVFLLAGWR
ncbi:MAG TPA: hypothetical protein VHE34_24880 [Puia sp.]|uniref:hypothetical protein n=1 Tax=Puia sp. TaxID=2045100 RepID=UPI002C93D29D|nr:hypothetical protein [Puia sp.]HVU98492.1 hypothetical protein [Puia sp.]